MQAVIEQISSLIQNDILHVDLHPGNVVVDAAGKSLSAGFRQGQRLSWEQAKVKKSIPHPLAASCQQARIA